MDLKPQLARKVLARVPAFLVLVLSFGCVSTGNNVNSDKGVIFDSIKDISFSPSGSARSLISGDDGEVYVYAPRFFEYQKIPFRGVPARIAAEDNSDVWLASKACALHRYSGGQWELVRRSAGGTVNDPQAAITSCEVEVFTNPATGVTTVASTAGGAIDPGGAGRQVWLRTGSDWDAADGGWVFKIALASPGTTLYGINRDRKIYRFEEPASWTRIQITAPGAGGDVNGDDIQGSDGALWVLQRAARRVWVRDSTSGTSQFCALPALPAGRPNRLSTAAPGAGVTLLYPNGEDTNFDCR